MLLLVRPGLAFLQEQYATSLTAADQQGQQRSDVMKLPNPSLKNGKLPPSTLYTSKNFDTALSATIHSRWVVSEGGVPPSLPSEACSTNDNSGDCATCSRGAAVPVVTDVSHNTEGEIHLPAGQHLLVDIQKVDYDFLASEERLATAMLDVVGECGLTLLSYHCHGLYPAGVSCVGVLLESHVSFHTWPAEGVITLDLFTCGANSLLPIVPTVERLFSVPRAGVTDLMDMPETIWAYKLRGFGEDTEESKAALTDLFTFPIGAMTEYKKEVWHYLVPGCHSCFWTLDPHRANRPPDRIILSFESADRYLRCPSIAVSDFDVL
jgi:S-adenosylmethionine decarboxylase proenzyme